MTKKFEIGRNDAKKGGNPEKVIGRIKKIMERKHDKMQLPGIQKRQRRDNLLMQNITLKFNCMTKKNFVQTNW